jgi:hypothetical protein
MKVDYQQVMRDIKAGRVSKYFFWPKPDKRYGRLG